MTDTTRPPEPDTQNSGVPVGDGEDGVHDTIIAGRDVYIHADREPRNDQFRRNRSQILEKVRLNWIKGFLEPSLYQFARIELGLATRPAAVERPFDLFVQRPEQAPQPLPIGTPISHIFDDSGNALLILGEPGAGKTTLLLELTRDLLDRAKQDERHLIPVVFHLSTWAEQRFALADWLIDELRKRYYVPRTLAKTWVDAGLILPLLDGLDEVAADHRDTCVKTINDFVRANGQLPLVVCSRIADYEALTVRLRLSSAVMIQALSRQQVENYVTQAGAALVGLRTILQHDETLRELLNTPLMLSIAALAYKGRSVDAIPSAGTGEEHRMHLFAAFTDAMFQPRSKVMPSYTRERTERGLTWLARAMKAHNQSVFYLEWMQPDWLPRKLQQWLVTFMMSVMSGLSIGLSVGLSVGLSAQNGLEEGLISGLTIGLIFGLKDGYSVGKITQSFLNEGVRGSVRNAIRGLSIGLSIGLVFGLIDGLSFGLIDGLRGGLSIGLIFGLIFGLHMDGRACLRHFALRLVLWQNHFAPLNYVRFLDYATAHNFLRKVGNGYTFIHPILLEYFAARYQTPAEQRNCDTNGGLIKALWKGEIPLKTTFWRFGFFGQLILNIPFIVMEVYPTGIFGVSLFIYWIMATLYALFIYVAIWRSATKYRGTVAYSGLAKVIVVLDICNSISRVFLG